ncbi:dash complex component protein [Alternaria panax]|uniref:DASH complex subunit DAM1 n=1 Tax=Alternaria panax TaxID=48097 RepID=A0AAD4ICW4_9PLEO|nr:dash complex component protein [Alternaria panax]
MASTTPTTTPSYRRTRSKSPRSRPTTPLRASSRSSLRDSSQRGRAASASGNALEGLQDGFAELSDAMADLEQNFLQLQLMHESLARFSESFAGFLYGMNMNAFCVDFPEAPVQESFKRPQNQPDQGAANLNRSQGPEDMEATFLTTDTSFVDNPPSSKIASKFQNPQTPAPAARTTGVPRGRGGIPRAGGRGGIPTRGGAPKTTRGGTGIARGVSGRGRGAR